MIRIKHLLPVLAAAVVALMPIPGKADMPGRHPFYLHARSDLRTAQWIAPR